MKNHELDVVDRTILNIFTEKCQMPIERDCSDLEEQRH